MKNAILGKRFWTSLLFVGLLSSTSPIWAQDNFYVVVAGKKAKRTVLVSPQGTPAQNGTALLSALEKITDASETNPYLIIIEPGIYDIGSSTFEMKSYVDVQGSGEDVTKITGSVSTGSGDLERGVLEGANNTELRFLTVEHAGGGMYANAILNRGASPALTHVTAKVTGGTYARAIHNAASSNAVMTHVTASASGGYSCISVRNDASSPTMTHVTATAFAATNNKYGVYNTNSASPTMEDVTLVAEAGGFSYGVYNSTSTARINHSSIKGSTYAAYGGGTGCSYIYIANSMIDGPTGTTCVLTCAGVFDENYVFYPSSCPP